VPFHIDRFVQLRPFLYHLTNATNVTRVLRVGRLESAARIFRTGKRPHMAIVRRPKSVLVSLGGDTVVVRDQAPLHPGHTALQPGWRFEDLVAYLNNRVFFWPGTEAGPIPSGLRYYERYASEKPAIVRVATAAIISANPARTPEFCRYNSGSPRSSNGVRSPRTAKTFVEGREAAFGAAQVVEVTFCDQAVLPQEVEVGSSPRGPWRVSRMESQGSLLKNASKGTA
jgi:hypothetical protein